MKVASILKQKAEHVHTVPPDATITTAAHELHAKSIGALVVSRDGRTIDGLLSERDIVNGLVFYGTRVGGLHVSDLMSHPVVTCTADDTITTVMARMTGHRVRHVLVVDDHQLRGIVSIGDVVKYRLDELETEASVLREAFIARQ
jgi:CBS domain-containing protein